MDIQYKLYQPGELNAEIIHSFLVAMDDCLTPKLSSRVNLVEFAAEIAKLATHYVAYDGNKLIGLCLFYVNDGDVSQAWLTYLCIDRLYQSHGIGRNLVQAMLEYCSACNMTKIGAVMRKNNSLLKQFYSRFGFSVVSEDRYPNSEISELQIEKIF